MSRKKRVGTRQKIVIGVSAAALVGGIAIATAGTSQASVACDGLATALSNNEKFIADQKANPDAQSAARIANREAVIKEIQVKQKAAGCSAGQGGDDAAGAPPTGNEPPASNAPPASEAPQGSADPSASGDASASAAPPAADGDVVCKGSTVTLSGESGAPAASSDQFPVGTKLKVTNLDNNKSTTVSVTSASGSCALLNNAAFEQVREEGKFLIRNARIERVG
ncbi:hypothetical protein SAMN05428945_5674 [Streptomyces sp. 2224.1]|uniref:hypothetical protein n=1 Tax=unclassified Streptomyces TaxID=2593676 RepID=UPI0008975695|nr:MULTISPECIES: hypothetical protein [unclassified Streptomyces]SED46414.1 hypothetical protein SAMN05428954_0353 [Streptomyces sp. 2112.3]SED82745.1 hypothetical protein SAMN05428945_5674 [Streptomyces sp. 2224.1]